MSAASVRVQQLNVVNIVGSTRFKSEEAQSANLPGRLYKIKIHLFRDPSLVYSTAYCCGSTV